MKTFKAIAAYLSVLGIGVIFFLILFIFSKTPEDSITGEWKEMEWKYEKVNKIGDSVILNTTNTDNLKKLLGKHLIIHEAENWIFTDDGKLELRDGKNNKDVHWRIIGRGHILKIKYDDEDVIEYYNITKLTENEMVLNFDSDIHARGIAKLTFKKVKNI